MRFSVVVTKRAQKELLKAQDFIAQYSVQASEEFERKIKIGLTRLEVNPERFGLDKFRLKNDGSFRAFELLNYRFTFRIERKIVRIIRIRHTKRSPKLY